MKCNYSDSTAKLRLNDGYTFKPSQTITYVDTRDMISPNCAVDSMCC